MIDSGEDFSNSGRVRDHADSSHDFSEITSWDNSWWLIVNTTFETSWAPINELDGSLGFDGSNGSVNIFWDNITSVHHTTGHIFSVSWVTFGHH
jgi:predicted Zn-dependent protease